MNTTKAHIAKLIQAVSAQIRGRASEHTIMHPTRHWLIGIFVVMALCVGVVWWSASVYLVYRSEISIDVEQAVSTSQVYRESLVTAALDEIRNRLNSHEQILVESIDTNFELLPVDDVASGSIDIATSSAEVAAQATTSLDIASTTDSQSEPVVIEEVDNEEEVGPIEENPTLAPTF